MASLGPPPSGRDADCGAYGACAAGAGVPAGPPACPPEPGRGAGAAPAPGRGAGAAPAPGRGVGAAPEPGRGAGAAPEPGRGAGAAPEPGRGAGAAPEPGRGAGAAPEPERGPGAPGSAPGGAAAPEPPAAGPDAGDCGGPAGSGAEAGPAGSSSARAGDIAAMYPVVDAVREPGARAEGASGDAVRGRGAGGTTPVRGSGVESVIGRRRVVVSAGSGAGDCGARAGRDGTRGRCASVLIRPPFPGARNAARIAFRGRPVRRRAPHSTGWSAQEGNGCGGPGGICAERPPTLG